MKLQQCRRLSLATEQVTDVGLFQNHKKTINKSGEITQRIVYKYGRLGSISLFLRYGVIKIKRERITINYI